MDKVTELIKKNLIALLLSSGVVGWTFVKDLINTGAEVKAQETFITFLKSKESVKFIESRVDTTINRTLENPFIWLEILSSSHIEDFAEKKATEVTYIVEEKIRKQDSVNGSFLSNLAKALDKREDKIFDFLVEMAREHEKRRTRVIRGSF